MIQVLSKYLKSIAFLSLIYLVTLWYFLPLCFKHLMGFFTGYRVSDREMHAQATRWGKRLFTLVPGWAIQIKGLEYLPKDQVESYVIVANHESAVDILVLYYLGLQFRWLAKDTIFRMPVIGQAMSWAGYIPVKRGDRASHRQALTRGGETLKRKISMLFFPEGTRSADGQIKEFKPGAFILAREHKTAILPIALYGTSKLLKKRSLSPFPAKVRMEILAPTYCQDQESVEDFSKRVEELIRAKRNNLALQETAQPVSA
jgi:1-acyl-sn-glycerol-3-phosphate acyltransferase